MPRMYHPTLTPPSNVADVPDVPACVAVFEEAGWVVEPEQPPPPPGIVAEPVTYAPVATAEAPVKAKRAAKSSTADQPDEDPDS